MPDKTLPPRPGAWKGYAPGNRADVPAPTPKAIDRTAKPVENTGGSATDAMDSKPASTPWQTVRKAQSAEPGVPRSDVLRALPLPLKLANDEVFMGCLFKAARQAYAGSAALRLSCRKITHVGIFLD